MEICEQCNAQSAKARYSDPHENLQEFGKPRIFRGLPTGGFEEQDYICKTCGTKFTYSNDKDDVGWRIINAV